MSEEFTPQQIRQVLDLDLGPNDSGEPTVRGYLVELLATVWRDEEGFSGKRPFGNSGWQSDLYLPLVKAGLVEGALDEDGYLDRVDGKAADALILAAIAALDAPREQITFTPIGYQGAAQHTYTTGCDGFHEPGQCPRIDDAEADL